MDFPGRGTIFVSLVAQFKRPIYPGDRVDFNAEIIELVPQWAKLVIRITAMVVGKLVLTADATVVLEDDLV